MGSNSLKNQNEKNNKQQLVQNEISTTSNAIKVADNTDDEQNQVSNQQIRNQPKLIISDYEINPRQVQAGEDFELGITFFNTNIENTIYNLKITIDQNLEQRPQASEQNNALSSNGTVFVPVDSSNTFYTRLIYPGTPEYKNITLAALPNAPAGNYVIGVDMEYEDYYGNQYKTRENIGISVVQKANVTYGDLTLDDLTEQMPGNVSLNIYNTGKDNLSTFMVKIVSDDFTVENDTYFIGNLQSGGQDTFQTTITPKKSGEINGKIVVTYEDSTGKTHEDVKKISANVNAAITEETQAENPDNVQSSSVSFPLLGGILLAVIILSVLIIRKIRKKKKEKELNVDEIE